MLQTGPFGSQLHSYDYREQGTPVVPTEAIGDRRLLSNAIPRISTDKAKELSRHRLQAGDILFARRGVQATGKSALVEHQHEGWLCGTGAILLRLNTPSVDPVFLSFQLTNPETIAWLRAHAVGAVMPNLNEGVLRRLHLLLPPFAEQQAIAHILATLDDKIELNRRMNATLEGMARAIFKSWFVDFDPVRARADRLQAAGMDAGTADLFPDSFEDSPLGKIPRGWKVEYPGNLMDFVIGGEWGKDAPEGDFTEPAFCIRGADIPDLQSAVVGNMPTRYVKPASLEKRHLRSGDLAFEISGGSPTQSTGRPVLITSELLHRLKQPLICSNFCRLIRPGGSCNSTFLYFLLRHLYHADEFLQFENGTTGIKNFAFTVFCEKYPVIVPDSRLQKVFEKQAGLLISLQQRNGMNAETLARARDVLRPRLLAGEVRVPDAVKLVEAAT